jgi:hypothetical protein
MIENDERSPERDVVVAANDNAPNTIQADAAVLRIARLIGRQLAREEFRRRQPANDNRQEHRDED